MSDTIETLSKVTGLSRKTMDQIWLDVKANHALLEKCPGHDFSIEHRKIGVMVRDWRCARCGGVVETLFKRWYELGLRHGKTPST